MEGPNPDQLLTIRMDQVPAYKLHLRLSNRAPGKDQMTVLLYAIDWVKEKTGVAAMTNPETELWFDEENPTTAEEVIKTNMEELLLKRKGDTNPFLDVLEKELTEEDRIYLNDKSQLIRIV